MSSVELIRSAHLVHAEYADAALIPPACEVILLAGVCPLDETGATVGVGDVGAQARKVLSNLDIALDACGAALADVASVRILVATTRRDDLLSRACG